MIASMHTKKKLNEGKKEGEVVADPWQVHGDPWGGWTPSSAAVPVAVPLSVGDSAATKFDELQQQLRGQIQAELPLSL